MTRLTASLRSSIRHVLLRFGFLLFATSAVQALPPGFPVTPRQVTQLTAGWSYHLGDVPGSPEAADFEVRGWKLVTVPHTYKLTSINLDDSSDDKFQATYHRDVSWYRRKLTVDATPGQRVFLQFEGAKQLTDLWINGQHAGTQAIGGYTPFHFDITDLVHPGPGNVIALRLDNRRNAEIPPDGHSADYVLFGGLYRDVYLVVTDALHVTFPWEAREAGVFLTTPTINPDNATISARTTVRNAGPTPRAATVVTRVIGADDVVALTLTESATVSPGATHTFHQTGGLDEHVRLWSFDDPYLYRVNTQIVADGRVVDLVESPLGLRTFELRAGAGFCLNGQPVELVGANRHQHYPYIGDAVPDNLHVADALKFKHAGMNLVRLAHYPHDDAFIAACDRLGILVTEEPPTWIEFGPPLWMDRLEESLRRLIRNHRNNPSVWAWGAGINHRGPVKRLHYAAKQEDPTRLTMNNGTVWTGPQHAGVTDLYAVMDYRDAVRPEGQFMFAMEHSGSADTLGLQKVVSRYRGDPWLIGVTFWSAHESSSFVKRDKRYPNLSRWSAAGWDPFRLPKPAFYWYQSELTTAPMVHIPDDRAQKPGTVTVLSNCEEVELLLDGHRVGRSGPVRNDDTKHLRSPSFLFTVAWTAGELTARGLRQGEIVAEHTLRKPGPAHHLELRPDPDTLPLAADGSSIALAFAHVCDAAGTTLETDTPPVRFILSGPGEIIGDDAIGANPVTWERGRAPVMIRAGTTPGHLTLTALAEGLQPATATITATEWTSNVVARAARPILEPLRLRVDLGNNQQHPEDGWTLWSADTGDSASATFPVSDGLPVRVSLTAHGAPLTWTHAWGVPGDLSFLIEDGVTSPARGAISLIFQNLPPGAYRLRTWHHVISADRTKAPPLTLRVSDADQSDRVAYTEFQPSYGGRIQVNAGGGGGRGDGGSLLGASNYAEIVLRSSGQPVTIIVEASAKDGTEGTIGLNGFDLRAIISGR